MTNIKKQFSDAELEAILRITQLMLDETRGFRISERKSGLTVSELVDIKRKIERVLGIPTMPLVDTSKPLVSSKNVSDCGMRKLNLLAIERLDTSSLLCALPSLPMAVRWHPQTARQPDCGMPKMETSKVSSQRSRNPLR